MQHHSFSLVSFPRNTLNLYDNATQCYISSSTLTQPLTLVEKQGANCHTFLPMPSTRQQTNATLASEQASAHPSGISSSRRNSRAASSMTLQGNHDATSRGRDATPIGDASMSNNVHEVSSHRRLLGAETSPTMLWTPATWHPISMVDLTTAT